VAKLSGRTYSFVMEIVLDEAGKAAVDGSGRPLGRSSIPRSVVSAADALSVEVERWIDELRSRHEQ